MRAKEYDEQKKVYADRVELPGHRPRKGEIEDHTTLRTCEFCAIQGSIRRSLRPTADEVFVGMATTDNRPHSGMGLVTMNMRKYRLARIISIWFD